MPKISVIVPVYKVEKYVNKCVDSILDQSFRDFDLILVDDGSPDSCPQICDYYASQDDRITVIHKTNGGLSDARNAGIDWAMEHSDSEWLAFVDSDDYLHPDYLNTLYQTAQNLGADLVICDFVRVNDEEEVIEEEHKFYNLVTEDKEELFRILNECWRIDVAWDKLYNKQIFSELRFPYGKIHEDEFVIHKVLWESNKTAILDHAIYNYRIREHSIMTSESPKSRLDQMEALIEQYEFSVQHGLTPRELLISETYLREVSTLKYFLDSEEAVRYKELKKRYADIFFSIETNTSLRRKLKFYFNGPCRLLYSAFRKLTSRL